MRALLLALLLAASPPAHAGLEGLVKLAARAGRFARVGEEASLAAKAARTGRALRVGGALSGVAVAERAALGLAALPDDVGRVAAFVAREGDGLTVVRADGAWSSVDDLGALADDALLLDPTVAVEPRLLAGVEGKAVYLLDAEGAAHAARRSETGAWVVDVVEEGASVAIDVGDFAADQLELSEEAAVGGEPPLWLYGMVGGAVVLFGAWEWRRQSRKLEAALARGRSVSGPAGARRSGSSSGARSADGRGDG
ncbi:MAG: hypothetical protein H6742_21255 [Alphaproteobacteria bacterium]|nr:hypothetical protein [Alphaproteobacteria bacterium]